MANPKLAGLQRKSLIGGADPPQRTGSPITGRHRRRGRPRASSILGNEIDSNTNLGIDLGHDGVTLNDAGDIDTGPNGLQNFPVLGSASLTGSNLLVDGTLNSTPDTTFRLEFFANAQAETSGHGEGERFLGFRQVTTDGTGAANFIAAFTGPVPTGQLVTATATDPDGNTSEFSATIEVIAPQGAPVAHDDNATAAEDSVVVVNVLANDEDPDGDLDPSSVEVIAGPDHGTFTVDPATGAVSYTPDPDFFGSDSLLYVVRDDTGVISNAATVSLTVDPVNDLPTAHDDQTTTLADTAIVIDVLANDDDVEGLDPATVEISEAPTHGTLSVDPATGAVTYTPDPGFSGPDSFLYTVRDLAGAPAGPATVTVDVNPMDVSTEVTTTQDVVNPFDNVNSLREAIATANTTPGLDTITFDIPASDAGHVYYQDDGVAGKVTQASIASTSATDDSTIPDIDPDWAHSWFSIQPATDLPQITDAVIIDGYTQPGASENTATVESRTGLETVLRIELDGSVIPASLGTGLVLADSGGTVRGLVINRFFNAGIDVGTNDNVIAGSFIGTDPSGSVALGNAGDGVRIRDSATGNLVGRTRLRHGISSLLM